MFRKTVIAVAATAVIAAASLTPASAHGHHGFGFGGIGFGLGLLGASIAASTYAPSYDSCWRYRQIVTRYGYVRNVMVNVCED
jgi:hypothetical protein